MSALVRLVARVREQAVSPAGMLALTLGGALLLSLGCIPWGAL